jgi:hypothetical protein
VRKARSKVLRLLTVMPVCSARACWLMGRRPRIGQRCGTTRCCRRPRARSRRQCSPGRAELDASEASILAKLLAYFQLALRKDAAIATDNATELTAINADGGSGAGAFANTTDAQEAIRDNMVEPDNTGIAAIQAQTDLLTFTGDDVNATLDGETVALTDASITAAKFDGSTAFPLAAADSGATQVARVGADSDTLETLSDAQDSILSKLLKYFQLALRKDSGVATDNATELTAINADGGSGAGAFANTTDAQEAIRDNMVAPDNTGIAAIQAQTDLLTFTGDDVNATLDGETVALTDASITAAKFDGSTAFPLAAASSTLATAAKLLAYFQLALRKDAAIATDNAAEVTAINADGGSGAGAFANTTDAQEAIADATAAVTASVDGVTYASLLEAMLAYVAGKTTLTDNGDGTKTLRFMKQDGTTGKIDVTFDANGQHTATDLDPA